MTTQPHINWFAVRSIILAGFLLGSVTTALVMNGFLPFWLLVLGLAGMLILWQV